ncbi:MAG: hypothetical protein P8126_04640 [Gammaproteobacteria bacterium]|jgi:hypothetical protein
MLVRKILPLLLYVALISVVPPARSADIQADEMSSVEWRDCAGHFFFLAHMLRSEGESDLVKQMYGMGLLAIYASEAKAKAELKAGQTKNGLGHSLADPETGKLKVEMQAMIDAHAAKIKTYPDRNAYVKAYAAKCSAPVAAFAKRWNNYLSGKK